MSNYSQEFSNSKHLHNSDQDNEKLSIKLLFSKEVFKDKFSSCKWNIDALAMISVNITYRCIQTLVEHLRWSFDHAQIVDWVLNRPIIPHEVFHSHLRRDYPSVKSYYYLESMKNVPFQMVGHLGGFGQQPSDILLRVLLLTVRMSY